MYQTTLAAVSHNTNGAYDVNDDKNGLFVGQKPVSLGPLPFGPVSQLQSGTMRNGRRNGRRAAECASGQLGNKVRRLPS